MLCCNVMRFCFAVNTNKMNHSRDDSKQMSIEIGLDDIGTMIKELNIPKLAVDVCFCVMIVIAIVVGAAKKCMKTRAPEHQNEPPERHQAPEIMRVEDVL